MYVRVLSAHDLTNFVNLSRYGIEELIPQRLTS